MGNKRRTHFSYNTYECTAVEEYLEIMAKEGWLLEKIRGTFFSFVKGESSTIKYSVDLKPKLSKNKEKNEEALLEYREYCKAAGWDYICETDKLQVFSSESNDEIVQINTDENEKFKAVLKESLYEALAKFTLALLFAINIYININGRNISYILATNFFVISIVAIMTAVIYNIIEGIGILRWSIRAKKCVKQNRYMPYNSYKQLLYRNIINKLVMYITVVMTLILSYFRYEKIRLLLLITVIAMIGIAIKEIYSYGNTKRGLNKNRITIFASSSMMAYTLGLICLLIVFFAEGTSSKNGLELREAELEKAPITAVDFGYENIKYSDYYIECNESTLAESINYIYFGIGDSNLSYDLLKSNKPWVIEFYEKRYLDNITKGKYGYEMILQNNNIINKLDDSIKVYSNDTNDIFFLVSKDKAIFISKYNNTFINTDKLLEIVYEKVFIKNL